MCELVMRRSLIFILYFTSCFALSSLLKCTDCHRCRATIGTLATTYGSVLLIHCIVTFCTAWYTSQCVDWSSGLNMSRFDDWYIQVFSVQWLDCTLEGKGLYFFMRERHTAEMQPFHNSILVQCGTAWRWCTNCNSWCARARDGTIVAAVSVLYVPSWRYIFLGGVTLN